MTETKGYNGWTNYETWNVKLWMDNDQGSCEYWQEQAQEAYDAASEPDRKYEAASALRETLKSYFEDNMHEMLDGAGVSCSMYADLLGAALSEVNWQEIAENMLADVEDEEATAE